MLGVIGRLRRILDVGTPQSLRQGRDFYLATLSIVLDAERAVRQEAADTSGPLADLRAAVELADTRTDDGEVNPDGTVSEYVLSATDWNRIVAIARGSKSDAAERAIAPFRAGEAADTSGLREDVDLWRIADNGSEWTRAWNGAIECIQREVVDRRTALRGATERPLDVDA